MILFSLKCELHRKQHTKPVINASVQNKHLHHHHDFTSSQRSAPHRTSSKSSSKGSDRRAHRQHDHPRTSSFGSHNKVKHRKRILSWVYVLLGTVDLSFSLSALLNGLYPDILNHDYNSMQSSYRPLEKIIQLFLIIFRVSLNRPFK